MTRALPMNDTFLISCCHNTRDLKRDDDVIMAGLLPTDA